jgi:hypothetical protein
MTAYYLIAGIVLLILGRKLFWLFSGLVGFLLALNLAQQFFPAISQSTLVLVALAAGVAGAFLAVMLQKIAIGLVGFLAGGYLVYLLLPALPFHFGNLIWVLIIFGAILGAVLASSMFDWALIILSSAIGAGVIASHLNLPSPFPTVIAIASFILGLVIQSGISRKE